jgi:hypothetical protein
MNDTPEDFIKDDVKADAFYFTHVPSDVFIGITGLEATGIPVDVWNHIFKPFDDVFQAKTREMINKYEPQIEAVVDNPPPCIKDRLLYQAVQYTTRAGAPYPMEIIDNMDRKLKEEYDIKYPDGTKEKLEQLKNIPLCKS